MSFRYAGQVPSKFCEDETTIWHTTLGFFRNWQETIQGWSLSVLFIGWLVGVSNVCHLSSLQLEKISLLAFILIWIFFWKYPLGSNLFNSCPCNCFWFKDKNVSYDFFLLSFTSSLIFFSMVLLNINSLCNRMRSPYSNYESWLFAYLEKWHFFWISFPWRWSIL